MSMHTHTHTHTHTKRNGLPQHPRHIQVCRRAGETDWQVDRGLSGGPRSGDRQGSHCLPLEVIQTHMVTHTDTHTRSHTHTHRREEMSIAAVAGHFRVEQADRRRGLRIHKCGKDGNCCINMLISLYRRQRPAVCLSVNNLRTNQRLLPPLAWMIIISVCVRVRRCACMCVCGVSWFLVANKASSQSTPHTAGCGYSGCFVCECVCVCVCPGLPAGYSLTQCLISWEEISFLKMSHECWDS